VRRDSRKEMKFSRRVTRRELEEVLEQDPNYMRVLAGWRAARDEEKAAMKELVDRTERSRRVLPEEKKAANIELRIDRLRQLLSDAYAARDGLKRKAVQARHDARMEDVTAAKDLHRRARVANGRARQYLEELEARRHAWFNRLLRRKRHTKKILDALQE